MTKIPIFLEQVNPLPDEIDAWAEQVAELFEEAIAAIEAQKGNYPMPDKGHAISAKGLSRKQREAGNLTKD